MRGGEDAQGKEKGRVQGKGAEATGSDAEKSTIDDGEGTEAEAKIGDNGGKGEPIKGGSRPRKRQGSLSCSRAISRLYGRRYQVVALRLVTRRRQ